MNKEKKILSFSQKLFHILKKFIQNPCIGNACIDCNRCQEVCENRFNLKNDTLSIDGNFIVGTFELIMLVNYFIKEKKYEQVYDYRCPE